MKFYRQLKAYISGIKPCTFETSHGHDFRTQRLGMRNKRDVAICKCSVCGHDADYDFLTGQFISSYADFEFKELTFAEITQQ